MNCRQRRFWQSAAMTALASLLMAAMTGCSGTYESTVTGTVSYDGKVLDRGTVTFHPTSGAAAYGKIGADGSFVLQTGEEMGIAPGTYKATVQSLEKTPSASPDNPPSVKALIPNKFNVPSQSGLSFTVEAGKNHFDIALPK